MSNLRDLFYSTINDIDKQLGRTAKEFMEKEVKKATKASQLAKLQKKLDDIEKKRKLLAEQDNLLISEKDNIKQEIAYIDKLSRDEQNNVDYQIEYRGLRMMYSSYNVSKTILNVFLSNKTTPAIANLLSFNEIADQARSMFQLACSVKEQRSIVMSIMNRDWRSLGIELPQLPLLQKFTVEDGIIKLPDSKFLLKEAMKDVK